MYTPQRWQVQTALVDMWLQHPNGTRLAQRFHAQEEEVTVDTNGPRVLPTLASPNLAISQPSPGNEECGMRGSLLG